MSRQDLIQKIDDALLNEVNPIIKSALQNMKERYTNSKVGKETLDLLETARNATERRKQEINDLMVRKGQTESNESDNIHDRMMKAAEKAGLDTTTFVHPKADTAKASAKIAPDLLEEGADTYRQRNAQYGDSYKRQGIVMEALLPNGVTLKSVSDFNRFTVFATIVSKMLRYSNDFNNPHDDSILDNMVYNALLLELDRNR